MVWGGDTYRTNGPTNFSLKDDRTTNSSFGSIPRSPNTSGTSSSINDNGSMGLPGQLPRPHGQDANGYYRLCRSLIIQVLANGTVKKLTNELKGDEAQPMVDFLSEMLDDKQYTLSQHERKHVLHLLVKLAKMKQVFPQSLELQNVLCDLGRHITAGAFGLIYKGIHEGNSICVKAVHVREGGIDKGRIRAHAGELILSAHLSHPNVLPFSGIYLSEESPPRVCMVSPWMENGDLLQYVKAFPNAAIIPLVHDVLSGLKYLHEFDIVHADLKARNILISGMHRAMLADFGISRVVVTAGTSTAEIATGTAYWMAPELFLEENPTPTRESDMWAFGCVCYEMVTGMPPFHQFKLVPHLINAFLKGVPIPPKPTRNEEWSTTKEIVWLVAERCWKHNPQNRPTVGMLQGLVPVLAVPDVRSPDSVYSRPKVNRKVDYHRIFEFLYQIRNSCSASPGSPSDAHTVTFEDELMRLLIESRQHAQQLDYENEQLRVRVETLEKDIGTLGDKLVAFRHENDDPGLSPAKPETLAIRREAGAFSKLKQALFPRVDRKSVTVNLDQYLPHSDVKGAALNPEQNLTPLTNATVVPLNSRLSRAVALFDYTASPLDSNELNLTKGDVLEVRDSSGKWWEVTKADGTKGIVPFNYLLMSGSQSIKPSVLNIDSYTSK